MSQHINFDTIFLNGTAVFDDDADFVGKWWVVFFSERSNWQCRVGLGTGWDMLGGTLGRTQQLVVTAKNSPHQNGNMYNF